RVDLRTRARPGRRAGGARRRRLRRPRGRHRPRSGRARHRRRLRRHDLRQRARRAALEPARLAELRVPLGRRGRDLGADPARRPRQPARRWRLGPLRRPGDGHALHDRPVARERHRVAPHRPRRELARSPPGAISFADVPVSAPSSADTTQAFPVLASAGNDTLHAVWLEVFGTASSRVRYARSTDWGASWTVPATLVSAGTSVYPW